MLSSAEIRQSFLDFFKSKGHHIVPSAPIVVKNDPTLMFTNAGMNQFKDYFLGNKQPPNQRIADTQKCLRVSGKHNDLEEVGVDTYHHTMFEMLGNWSFGIAGSSSGTGYFKKEAIAWSWELLTSVLQIPVDRLYVTVFEGDGYEGLPKDEEAELEWRKWIAGDRILLGNKKDNFWEMGDTGPCGPCTEIHVDTRSDAERQSIDGKTLINADHPQVIEIWNNVFIQFNRLKDGTLQPLPAKHVDTGMGFERLVRVIQGKSSNYDTDVFSGTIKKVEALTDKRYTGSDSRSDVAFRVLADHIRAIAFTIADGQLPSNTGAGYVIRRILRRAVRYYYSYLGFQQPLLHQLLPVLAHQFATVFPELQQQEAFVTKVIKEEEEGFLRTLEKGLKRIENIIAASKETISGKDAFELNDTYGFPLDLTQLIATERGLHVDEEGFYAARKEQQERGRKAGAVESEDWILVNSAQNNSLFVGYDQLETKANMLRYRRVKAKGKEAFQVVLDRTPFYAESGGQVGDTGSLVMHGKKLAIFDTKKENDLIIHFAETSPEEFTGELTALVDVPKRKATQVHHSATHLLHAALRIVLGPHVAQKGSLVSADYLRFDFSQPAKMTAGEITEVERLVNKKIRENIPVVIKEMEKEEAMKSGATALFGEKYGDKVRVVTIDPAYSVELCGGTHAGATGELGFFKITSESAVAAGVRRVEALCGEAAQHFIDEQLHQFQRAKDILKAPKDLVKSIESVLDENSALKKQLEGVAMTQLNLLKQSLLLKIEQINGLSFLGEVVEVTSADHLKKLAADLKSDIKNSVIILAGKIDGKAAVAVALHEDVISSQIFDAVSIIKKHIAPLIRGGGGGQKSLATAGGQDASTLQEAIQAVRNLL